ncbi:TetR/AcrR family transcriptional regulator [Sciscionella marina]|uniref:TetR/AcrR family transcriptional regulator n=1 Tax=Sciscionella marina TaxID=508770 RepID=UPI0012F6FDC2|nr:TetR family transcriptional regulator [Sciscionella marina]
MVTRRGRPARLSMERILAVAIPKHPDQLTMQAVAAELDVAPSALYRWVRDREQLLDLVAAELGRRMRADTMPSAEDWRDWLVEYAYRMREGLREIPGFAIRLLEGPHRHTGPPEVQAAVVEAFRLGGVPEERAEQYWHVYSSAIIGWVAAEQNAHYRPSPAPDFDVLVDVLLRGTEPLGCDTDQQGRIRDGRNPDRAPPEARRKQ